LEAALEERIEKEKVLQADAKRKSETARQLLTAKDQEIETLREKLRSVKTTALGTPQTPLAAPVEAAAPPSRRGTEVAEKDGVSAALPTPTALFVSPTDSSVFSAEEVGEPFLLPSSPCFCSYLSLPQLQVLDQLRNLRASSRDDVAAGPGATVTPACGSIDMAVFNEELFRRAVARETELLTAVRAMRAEVRHNMQWWRLTNDGIICVEYHCACLCRWKCSAVDKAFWPQHRARSGPVITYWTPTQRLPWPAAPRARSRR
jgi:hypothetical protein